MNSLPISISNIDLLKNTKYFFCPSGNCLNIPEINYSYNPLKTDFKYTCSCQNDINPIKELALKEFLEQASNLNCLICKKKIFDEQIIYCIECKVLLDATCVPIHHKEVKHTHYIQLNKNIFNYCLEHKCQFIFRCMDCKQSLCNKCNFSFHDDNGHKLEQIKKFSLNQNDFQRIKNNFEKQKNFFIKIKEINNKLIQTLENDIELKERIINNFMLNKLDYNSLINMNKIYIENNQKYEKILDDILSKNDEINNTDNNTLKSRDYIKQFMATLYYSLMINKEDNTNDSLINELLKNVNNLEQPCKMQKNGQMNIDNQLLGGNMSNYNILENSKNISKISFEKDKSLNCNDININNNHFLKVDSSSQQDDIPKLNIPYFAQDNSKEKNKNFNFPLDYDSFNQKYSNFYFSINDNINKNKNNSTDSSENNGRKNIILNNSIISLSQASSEKNNNNKSSKMKSYSLRKSKKKTQFKKPKKNEESNVSSENQEFYSEDDSKKEGNKKINNYINNMIVLKSGNVAVSLKEAIEIYNIRKLNFSGANYFYNNDLIQNKCLIQRINIVKNRKISYVFELFDETLLCATYAKIFRIKLTNNDTNYEIMSFLSLGTSELPTKIISLEKSFLVILSEQKINCNIKIFQKIDNEKNEDNTNENNNNEKKEEFNKPNNNDENSSNFEDVPAIGNCGLYATKEIYEDTTYEILCKNINEMRRLWVSIFPLEKTDFNKKSRNYFYNEENTYLYEFIATSNAIYDLGKNKIAFYGIKKNKRNDYIVTKIKELDGISCSAEADSICKINEKYICIGLQNHNLNGQISGFAFIDIDKRELCKIVCDQEISCVCYNMKNNLLFAAMEVRDPMRNYFMTKIYKVINEKDDRGNNEIGLKEIYQYKNKQSDIITSIQQIGVSNFNVNLEQKNIFDNIIFTTSSRDSTLEVVKAEI